jgi:FMN phosphatase YigB (HAD superfamily)
MSLLEQARHSVREQATRAFSFDVFDTYLLRRCTTPEGVYEQALAHTPIAGPLRNRVETFVQHRIQCEAHAHRVALAARGSPEVTIEEIYRHFPYRLFGLPTSALPAMVEAELTAEIELCFVNPEIAQLYDELRASGVSVGFLSDTYWNKDRLAHLLRACRPDLQWDFLYPSCHYRTAKSENLFTRYIAGQRLNPETAIHIGDNPVADVKSARRHGIRAIHYPQTSDRLAAILSREGSVAGLLGDEFAGRLDGGLRTVRRLIARRTPRPSPSFATGVEVVGPIMSAFDRFTADRVERLASAGGRAGIAFIARDGRLPYRLWKDRGRAAAYLEVNRRVAMLAATTEVGALADFFENVPEINAPTFAAILKTVPPRVAAFFARQPDGVCSGKVLAKKLPSLIGRAELRAMSAHMRSQLMTYLRNTIPDFDRLTDLAIVDLGYTGTMQKALRRILDSEGIPIRLHGVYLISADDAFADIDENDTAEGFLSGLVISPQVSRTLLHNIALLEQLCSDPVGSVRNYCAGKVVREPDPRPTEQCALREDVQDGALHFARTLGELALDFDAYDDSAWTARTAAVALSRLLLLPTDDELNLFGGMRHDVNLGTQALAAMADPTIARDVATAQALPDAFVSAWPPMWLGGSMAALSPAHGFLYALFATGLLSSDVFGDAKCGSVPVTLAGPGRPFVVEASCFRTGFGDVRIKIPLARDFGIRLIAIPLGRVAPQGLLRGITFQSGKTVSEASFNRKITRLEPRPAPGNTLTLQGEYYSATDADGHIVIEVPTAREAASIIAVEVTPLVGARVLASTSAD